MYEETVERIARMMAEDSGDPQHWGVYATRAMEIISVSERMVDNINAISGEPSFVWYGLLDDNK